MSSTSVHSAATMRSWMKRTTNATFGIDKGELVQVALLQIHGGDGAYLSVLLGSLIGVSLVHSCPICSARYTSFSYISQSPQLMVDRWNLSEPTRPSRCTSPQSDQLWVANHDIMDIVRNDSEFHNNSFWYISSARWGPQNALSVLRFCRAEHHVVAPSWWRSSGFREHPLAIG